MSGKEIVRVDWGNGEHTRYDVAISDDESRTLDQMRAWPNAPAVEPSATNGGLIAGISARQAEVAAYTLEQIAEETPDLYDLKPHIAELSDGTRAAIGRAIAKNPNSRRGELLQAFTNEFTLEQAIEFKTMHGELPEHLHEMILDWAEEE